MSFTMTKHYSNAILALLGVVALVHSLLRFGTGELPEAILAGLLFLNAFSNRRQSWTVIAVAILAIGLTWTVNSVQAVSSQYRGILSWIGIALFAVLAFSRYILDRSPKSSGGDTPC
jgi:membrane-bound ClpP family serine protease